jgi:hypothetical protein
MCTARCADADPSVRKRGALGNGETLSQVEWAFEHALRSVECLSRYIGSVCGADAA